MEKSTKRIAVFTGNRAEYGLQKPILKAIKNSSRLKYYLIVSGAHLDQNFGKTIQEIESDGFEISAQADISVEGSGRTSTPFAIGSAIMSISKILDDLKPDLMLVYADRFEGFAAVIAATQMNIPTAHIEGGDITEGGALDDSVRHAMSKLSHIHFTSNVESTRRLRDMGEEDWRIHTVGFPAIDLINEFDYASENEVVENLSLDLERPIVLFTQHSVTTEWQSSKNQFSTSIQAIRKLLSSGIQVVLTYPNNDVGSDQIICEIEKLKSEGLKNLTIRKSLGRYLYHGVLALALNPKYRIVCLGNSSSGIKETAAFKCGAINIGSRQESRLRGSNVFDVNYDSNEIYETCLRLIDDQATRLLVRNSSNPYFQGGASSKIVKILEELELDSKILRKKMTLRYPATSGGLAELG